MIHPDEVEEDLTEGEKRSGKFVGRINLLNEERENLFYSAILVTFVQMTTIYLIMVSFEEEHGFTLLVANTYFVMIPRVTSSIMMHLICAPDIRDGIQLMKYALNHPKKFRVIKPGMSDLEGSSV